MNCSSLSCCSDGLTSDCVIRISWALGECVYLCLVQQLKMAVWAGIPGVRTEPAALEGFVYASSKRFLAKSGQWSNRKDSTQGPVQILPGCCDKNQTDLPVDCVALQPMKAVFTEIILKQAHYLRLRTSWKLPRLTLKENTPDNHLLVPHRLWHSFL